MWETGVDTPWVGFMSEMRRQRNSGTRRQNAAVRPLALPDSHGPAGVGKRVRAPPGGAPVSVVGAPGEAARLRDAAAVPGPSRLRAAATGAVLSEARCGEMACFSRMREVIMGTLSNWTLRGKINWVEMGPTGMDTL